MHILYQLAGENAEVYDQVEFCKDSRFEAHHMIQDRNGPAINLDSSARSANWIFLLHQRSKIPFIWKCVLFLNLILFIFFKKWGMGGGGLAPRPSPCVGPDMFSLL